MGRFPSSLSRYYWIQSNLSFCEWITFRKKRTKSQRCCHHYMNRCVRISVETRFVKRLTQYILQSIIQTVVSSKRSNLTKLDKQSNMMQDGKVEPSVIFVMGWNSSLIVAKKMFENCSNFIFFFDHFFDFFTWTQKIANFNRSSFSF